MKYTYKDGFVSIYATAPLLLQYLAGLMEVKLQTEKPGQGAAGRNISRTLVQDLNCLF